MNPGRRRLLIPGLLVALLIVVAVASFARRADAQLATEATPVPEVSNTQVSVMSDPRITESSGLAASTKHPGIAYTFNDSGHAAEVFAVDIASGKTVGVTTLEGVTWKDAEAMALWNGQVWVGDVGSNFQNRTDRALYSFPEMGPGNHTVQATRYPLTFAGKPVEVEAMSIASGRFDFYSKAWTGGRLYSVGTKLKKDADNIAYPTGWLAPAWTTDASATADGRLILVRGSVVVEVRDAKTWRLRYSDAIPILRQGESIAVEASGTSYLIGSEGKNSPLVRIAFDPLRVDANAQSIDTGAQYNADRAARAPIWEHRGAQIAGGVVALLLVATVLIRWRSSRRRRKDAADGN